MARYWWSALHGQDVLYEVAPDPPGFRLWLITARGVLHRFTYGGKELTGFTVPGISRSVAVVGGS